MTKGHACADSGQWTTDRLSRSRSRRQTVRSEPVWGAKAVKSSVFKFALFSIVVLLILAAAAGYAWAESPLHRTTGMLGPDVSKNAVSDLLAQNSKLSQKLQRLQPPGTNLQTAASGFGKLGQFVAAIRVSHNLGVPSDQLNSEMIETPTDSLGQAIQALKPDANS